MPQGINDKIDQIGSEFNDIREKDKNELFREQSRSFASSL